MAAIQQSGLAECKKIAVIGFGMTGQSIMRFFAESTAEIIAMDSRDFPPNKQALQTLFPKARLVTGGLDQHTLETADIVVVSPGVDVKELDLAKRVGAHTQIMGDIQLFAQHAVAPIIAITGSNGKSTVASLVDLIINAAGKKALLGGNIGIPALDLLSNKPPDFYVLELSSFQLDTTQHLGAQAAVVLNVSDDHLDRYASFSHYAAAKSTIYRGAKKELINRNDTLAPSIHNTNTISFGFDTPPTPGDYGLQHAAAGTWIVKGEQRLLNVAELKLQGKQNWLNVMAAFALADLADISLFSAVDTQSPTPKLTPKPTLKPALLKAVCDFAGLPHRCEIIARLNAVVWINDSKGTNIGATLAAISGIAEQKILILGGQGKGVDFTQLRPGIDATVRACVLLGEDAPKIAAAIGDLTPCHQVKTLQQAVTTAHALAPKNAVVLFSPACSSLDMFANFMARGDAFKQAVHQLSKGGAQ